MLESDVGFSRANFPAAVIATVVLEASGKGFSYSLSRGLMRIAGLASLLTKERAKK